MNDVVDYGGKAAWRETAIWACAAATVSMYVSLYFLCPDFWRETSSSKLAFNSVEFFSLQLGFGAWNLLPGVLLCLVGRKHASVWSARARTTGAAVIGVAWVWASYELWHTSTVCMGLGWAIVFWPVPLWLVCGIVLIIAVTGERRHRSALRELSPS